MEVTAGVVGMDRIVCEVFHVSAVYDLREISVIIMQLLQ